LDDRRRSMLGLLLWWIAFDYIRCIIPPFRRDASALPLAPLE
jgi:hypothetical protein